MHFKIHEVGSEIKLNDLAKLYNVTPDQIKKYNPTAHIFKTILGSTEYVGHSQKIQIPIYTLDNECDVKHDASSYTPVARYRCTQHNITKALEDITLHSTINTQYLIGKSPNKEPNYHFLLEDYFYQIYPKELEHYFELVKAIEFFKNDAIVNFNDNGVIQNILNLPQIEDRWLHF